MRAIREVTGRAAAGSFRRASLTCRHRCVGTLGADAGLPSAPAHDAARAIAAAAVCHEVVWKDGGKLTVFDKTQGVQRF